MKVIILAGGFGTRLSEYTDTIPKPMVTVGGRPIIWHIMQTFASYGHKDFLLGLGYKAETLKEYFLNYKALNSDFKVDLASGDVTPLEVEPIDWNVTLVDTGLDSMTGGRVKRLAPLLDNEPFMVTYGDGVANVDVEALVDFHKGHGKMITVTAVHPGARFGELEIDNDQIKSFKEKPQTGNGWINGGYFVVQPEFLDLIDGDDSVLEREPLETAAAMGEMMAYKHDGFWQCMDTKRDRDHLEELWASGEAPWRS